MLDDIEQLRRYAESYLLELAQGSPPQLEAAYAALRAAQQALVSAQIGPAYESYVAPALEVLEFLEEILRRQAHQNGLDLPDRQDQGIS